MAVSITIKARSRNGRTVYAAGMAWGTAWRTFEALPTQAADIWDASVKGALAVEWPPEWASPIGTYPGRVAPPAARPAAPAIVDPATPTDEQPATWATAEASRTFQVTMPAAPLPPEVVAPALPAPPTVVYVSPVKADPLPKTSYNDAKTAEGAGLIFGLFADTLRTMGVRPSAPREDADLGPGLTLETLLDELSETIGAMRLTPVQRALVRAADGRSTAGVVPQDGLQAHLSTWTDTPFLPKPPSEVYLRCGVRCGKTYLSAIGVLKSALTCSTRAEPSPDQLARGVKPGPDGLVSLLQPGETIKVVFCTPKAEQSEKAFSYVVGAVTASPRLSKYIVRSLATYLRMRRPSDGVEIEFVMVAASSKGTNIRSGWLAGALFDECAFFDDGDEAAVNLRDNIKAATTRLLPGAQAWMPSSPWSDSGHWHDLTEKTLKAQARGAWSVDALAFQSGSYAMFPELDPELRRKAMAENPLDAAREFDALPIPALSNLFFPPTVLALAVNETRTADNGNMHLGPILGVPHYAGTDLAFSRNSSTIAIARNVTRITSAGVVAVSQVAYHEELIPPIGTPLVPGTVVHHFGSICQQYGCLSFRGDNAATASVLEHLATLPGSPVAYDLYKPTMESNTAIFSRARELMAAGRVEIANDPRLLRQLKGVLGKALPGGKYQVILPKHGRAHGDIVVALVHAIVMAADQTRVQLDYDPQYDASLTGFDTRGLARIDVRLEEED